VIVNCVLSLSPQLGPSYKKYRDVDDTVVVRLDKALYGCVKASLLWYKDLQSKLTANGFTDKPYDRCVFNKIRKCGKQISIVLYVNDLMVTLEFDAFGLYLKSVFPEMRNNSWTILWSYSELKSDGRDGRRTTGKEGRSKSWLLKLG
jgi:Reverse transcriptase (RNA-dependent DNA polymerase)